VNVTNIIYSYPNLTINKSQFTACSYSRNTAHLGAVYSGCNATTFFFFFFNFAILCIYIFKADTEIPEQFFSEFDLVTDTFHEQNFLGVKKKSNLKYISRFNSYRTVNTPPFGYKNQSVNAV